MIRIGIIFGVAAAIAFAAGFIIPLPAINVIVALGSVIALGWGAGYTAAKTAPAGAERGIGRGAIAGAIAGGVVLLISSLAFLVLANSGVFQQLLREALQQPGIVDPNTGQPTSVDPIPAAIIGGAAGGLCLGLINLVLMFVGGAVGGWMWNGGPNSTTPAANTRRSTNDASHP